jgi:muramoyltetrapeptide carboxypeptidase
MTRVAPDDAVLMPARLKIGDKVRFVSPASTPDRAAVWRRAAVLESWGLKVDVGEHAFRKLAYLAGPDEERLADLDAAFQDPSVRAIVATRGGKGSYRIAERLDFAAVRRDPKFLVGFSDITILHLSLWQHCRLIGVHGALMDDEGAIDEAGAAALRAILMTAAPIVIRARDNEPTAALTTAAPPAD